MDRWPASNWLDRRPAGIGCRPVCDRSGGYPAGSLDNLNVRLRCGASRTPTAFGGSWCGKSQFPQPSSGSTSASHRRASYASPLDHGSNLIIVDDSRAARRTCLSKYVRSCALRTSGSIGRPFTPVICHKRPPPKFRALIYNATNLSARRRNRTPDRHNNHNWGHKRYAMPRITAPAISPPARPGPQPPPRHRASAGDGTADAGPRWWFLRALCR